MKEALHNIITHAKTTVVKLDFILTGDELSVIISDNGLGMAAGNVQLIRRRVEEHASGHD